MLFSMVESFLDVIMGRESRTSCVFTNFDGEETLTNY